MLNYLAVINNIMSANQRCFNLEVKLNQAFINNELNNINQLDKYF